MDTKNEGGRGIYMAEHAALNVSRCGQKWRPSNGHEGDLFMGRYCAGCSQENYDEETGEGACEINMRAFFFEISDEKYPADWQYGTDGQPICTAFKARGE